MTSRHTFRAARTSLSIVTRVEECRCAEYRFLIQTIQKSSLSSEGTIVIPNLQTTATGKEDGFREDAAGGNPNDLYN